MDACELVWQILRAGLQAGFVSGVQRAVSVPTQGGGVPTQADCAAVDRVLNWLV